MNKQAMLFPGQGSQYIGMFENVKNGFPESEAILKDVDEILGMKLTQMVAAGNMKELTLSEHGQPAVVVASYLRYQAYCQDYQELPRFLIGHSLGEISAYLVSGAIAFDEGLAFVRARGRIMDQALREKRGEAGIVVDLAVERLASLVAEVQQEAYLTISGYNSPRQFVVAGTAKGMQLLDQKIDETGSGQLIPFRMMPMKANAPYHSELMAFLTEELAAVVDQMTFRNPEIPIVSTVTGTVVTSKDEIAELLKRQLVLPIQWNQALSQAVALGADCFWDIGPGETIKNLVKEHHNMPETLAFDANIDDRHKLA